MPSPWGQGQLPWRELERVLAPFPEAMTAHLLTTGLSLGAYGIMVPPYPLEPEGSRWKPPIWPENHDTGGPSASAELCSSAGGRERQDHFPSVCRLSRPEPLGAVDSEVDSELGAVAFWGLRPGTQDRRKCRWPGRWAQRGPARVAFPHSLETPEVGVGGVEPKGDSEETRQQDQLPRALESWWEAAQGP